MFFFIAVYVSSAGDEEYSPGWFSKKTDLI